MNTPGQNANAVAELVCGMLVYSARNKFNGKVGSELKGKTLGLHGFGAVGHAVATIAKGFGTKVYAFELINAVKSGGQTEDANVNAGLAAAHQIVAFFERGEKNFIVNK